MKPDWLYSIKILYNAIYTPKSFFFFKKMFFVMICDDTAAFL